jgi:glycine betaine catabolism B
MKQALEHRAESAEPEPRVPTIEHAGMLEDLPETPSYLIPGHHSGHPQLGKVSCSFCGVGDSSTFKIEGAANKASLKPGDGVLSIQLTWKKVQLPARVTEARDVEVFTASPLTPPNGTITGELTIDNVTLPFMGRAIGVDRTPEGKLKLQRFAHYTPKVQVTKFKLADPKPTSGCVKLRLSTMHQRAAYPIHIAPSVLDRETGQRRSITYEEAISRFADLLLRHREPGGRTLVYASGQIDYFSIFAMQEVLRLLGVRNLTGNAEHCLNAGAVHNEVLTGQEGPFITIDQALNGPKRLFVLNGWNGLISHPPVYRELTKRPDLDAYLVEVMVSETAKGLAQKLGADHVLLIRPRTDAHLALAIAHEIFQKYPEAIEQRFIEQFADKKSFTRYKALARSAQCAPTRVAERIAPEPQYRERLYKAIRMMAFKLADPDTVPIAIPSVGLSQSSGIVAHCMWGNLFAMLGKYGLKPDGTPAGGVLRVPGQINAESEVQGLGRKYFLGRIPMDHAADAARRMDLPDNAYERTVKDTPRAALDYSDDTPGEHELFLCVGTQFEANMPNRRRWLNKLTQPSSTLVVIDPIPDPWSERNAELIIPSPPHPATTKLYQNGEWKLSISMPQKRAARETRSDATILYDVMAEITRRLEEQEGLLDKHEDLKPHLESGYLRKRFCHPETPGEAGLTRLEGEVSRVELWDRVQDYLHGGRGPLYCSFDHADGTPIKWEELLSEGSLIYGGVGVNRYVLDYDDPAATPFRNIYREPGRFRFFCPTEEDLSVPEGVIFNSGRSSLSDDRQRIHFATSTFNSGKATPVVKMPDEHPLYVSTSLAGKTGLESGDIARVQSQNGQSIELPVVVTDRVKGDSVYVSFHRSMAQEARGLYINDVTDHVGRCPYSAQVQLKVPRVTLERVGMDKFVTSPTQRIDMTVLDTQQKLPLWTGTDTPLYVADIFKETHDVYTFRFQGDPLCRFAYKPGQFCSLVLEIDGKKVVRSYSISSTPTRPYTLELTVKRVPGGLVSNWLPDNLRVGDRVQIKGPKGKFCLEPGNIPRKLLFVGAGSGVTPLMSMSRWLCDISADVDIKFYCSVRSSRDIIFAKELEMMTERYRMFSPCVFSATQDTGDESWTGRRGRIDHKTLEEIAPDLHDRHIYMCGPNGFMDAVKDLLREVKFDMSRLHLESFGGTRTAKADAAPQPGDNKALSVQFAQTGKTVRTNGAIPLLDLAEEHDIDVEYGCRSGSCGDCKVRVLKGEVSAETDEGLTQEEIEAGYVLSCIASPQGDCIIDA